MTNEWELEAAKMAQHLEEGETLHDYPEEYYREFDLLYARAVTQNQAIQEAATMDDECPW